MKVVGYCLYEPVFMAGPKPLMTWQIDRVWYSSKIGQLCLYLSFHSDEKYYFFSTSGDLPPEFELPKTELGEWPYLPRPIPNGVLGLQGKQKCRCEVFHLPNARFEGVVPYKRPAWPIEVSMLPGYEVVKASIHQPSHVKTHRENEQGVRPPGGNYNSLIYD